jgi:hypothetical protein
MDRRSNRRRSRNIHDGRAPNSRVTIDAFADNGEIDGIDKLIMLIASASGDTTLSLAELRRAVCGEVLAAGGVAAAIRHREIILS